MTTHGETQARLFDAAGIAARERREGQDPLAAVIGQLAGFASVCWDDMSGTGVFHSDEARDAVDSVVEWLRGEIGAVTRVGPHDQLMVVTNGALDAAEAQRIREQFTGALGDTSSPVIVADGSSIRSLVVFAAEYAGPEDVGAPVLYLAGPMTGLPEFNYPAFDAAAAQLREAGVVVESPAEPGQVPGWTAEQYYRRGLAQMLRSDAVATLPGWENSTGARLEVAVAGDVGMPVKSLQEWLDDFADAAPVTE